MKRIGLSGNMLKILAAIFMVVDHVGLMFFPTFKIFRIIGRLSFPIFAFMISEGARYTKNKLRYFLMLFSLATLCQVVYYFFDGGSLYMCILVSFSIAVALIYLLKYTKKKIFDKSAPTYVKVLLTLAFFAALCAVYFINTDAFNKWTGVRIDYGFSGIMLPVFASLLDFRGVDAPESVRRFDKLPARVMMMAVAMLMLVIELAGVNTVQVYSLLALPLLLLYNGERGRARMKYFFYIFYPLHLVVLEGIFILLYIL